MAPDRNKGTHRELCRHKLAVLLTATTICLITAAPILGQDAMAARAAKLRSDFVRDFGSPDEKAMLDLLEVRPESREGRALLSYGMDGVGVFVQVFTRTLGEQADIKLTQEKRMPDLPSKLKMGILGLVPGSDVVYTLMALKALARIRELPNVQDETYDKLARAGLELTRRLVGQFDGLAAAAEFNALSPMRKAAKTLQTTERVLASQVMPSLFVADWQNLSYACGVGLRRNGLPAILVR